MPNPEISKAEQSTKEFIAEKLQSILSGIDKKRITSIYFTTDWLTKVYLLIQMALDRGLYQLADEEEQKYEAIKSELKPGKTVSDQTIKNLIELSENIIDHLSEQNTNY